MRIKKEIENLCDFVSKSGFEVFCFVRDIEGFEKFNGTSIELMNRARLEISKSDYFLVDYDGPSTGRFIEMGIAFALGKKIIVIKSKNINLKNTIEGVADFIIEYEKFEEIIPQLTKLLNQNTF